MQVCFKAIRLVLCGTLLGSLVVTITWFGPQAGAQETVPESNDDSTVRYVSPSEAFEEDVAQRAHDTGQTVDQVRQTMLFESAFAEYTDILFARYKDSIAGIWVEQEPTIKGVIRFIDEVPADAVTKLTTFDLLNSRNVVLLDNGVVSMEDHHRRASLATSAVVELGYQEVVTSFNPKNQKLEVEIKLPEGVSQPHIHDLVAPIQQQLHEDQSVGEETSLQGTATILDEDDLELMVLRGSGPIIELQIVR